MATKRSAPDSTPHDFQPHKRRKSSSFNRNHPTAPANLKSKLGKNSYKKAHPVNELKSQIRNIRRLLERADKGEKGLPATVRVEKERALRTAEEDLARAEAAKKRSEIIGRWHKIRFFERQKAERRLKKLKKQAKEEIEEDQELAGRIADAEVDVNYAIFYPLEEDYVPLWPSKKAKEAAKKGNESEATPEQEGELEREGDADMWQLVRRCMADQTLQDLREGRLSSYGATSPENETLEAGSKTTKPVKQKDSKRARQDRQPTTAKKGSARRGHKAKSVEDEENSENEEDLHEEDETGAGFFDN